MSKNNISSNNNKITYSKKILFGFITCGLFVVLFFSVEIALRAIHYGPNLDLFTTETINGTRYYRMNPQIGERYFYQIEFLPYTSPELFTVEKLDSTYRIFCLGASTTVGYPYWFNASFSSFLRHRLHSMFPGKKTEIINLGLTATNSFTVVDLARELRQYKPDLIIVYDGHNEFYGALGTESEGVFGSSRWIRKLSLSLVHIRTFSLARNIIYSIAAFINPQHEKQERGTTMELLSRGKYIPYNSESFRIALQTFKENIEELKSICSKNNIPVILSSQVSNIRTQPPFISGELPKNPNDQRSFSSDYELAKNLFTAGSFDSSLHIFRNLLTFDSLRADIHFHIGKCLEQKNDMATARLEFVKARDYDQLRFRASSEFNIIIEQACDSNNIVFADIEGTFEAQSPDSLIGNELILEHLHPNSKGYFLMAKAYMEIMKQHQFFASKKEWDRSISINDQEEWNSCYVTEIDEKLAKRKVSILTAAWPFTEKTIPSVSRIAENDTIGFIVEKIVRNQIDWLSAHLQAAEIYNRNGDKNRAIKEYEVIIDLLPYIIQPYFKAARLYQELGNVDRVKYMLRTSLTIKKTMGAYRALGDISLKENHPKEALAYYREISSFDQTLQERLQTGYVLTQALIQAGYIPLAQDQLHLLLQMKPDFTPAKELLTMLERTDRAGRK